MPGFVTYQEIVEAQRRGQTMTYSFFKVAPTIAESGGVWMSLWIGGVAPASGVQPGNIPGTTYTNSSTSITFPDVSPARKYITKFGAYSDQNMAVMVYDRLWGVGNLEMDVTHTINGPTVPRYDGAQVQAWMELEDGPATAGGRLLSYTNQDGVAGRSGVAMTWPEYSVPWALSLLGPLPLQAGDTGVRSVQSFAGASSATTAQTSLILMRPLLYHVSNVSAGWVERDLVLEGNLLPRVYDGASLAIAVQSASTVAATVYGQIEVTWA